jgi:Ca2+-binding EF-hand superfamily protein
MGTLKSAATAQGLLAVLLISTVLAETPAGAADHGEQQGQAKLKQDFKMLDKNKDGYLSMEEFKATGMDDLAFNAADVDGDGRLSPEEYAKYVKVKATDQEMRDR